VQQRGERRASGAARAWRPAVPGVLPCGWSGRSRSDGSTGAVPGTSLRPYRARPRWSPPARGVCRSGAVHPVVRTPAMSGAPGNGVRIRPPAEAPQYAGARTFAQEGGNDKPPPLGHGQGGGCTRGGAGSSPVALARQGSAAPRCARGPGRARGRRGGRRAGSFARASGEARGGCGEGARGGGWRGRPPCGRGEGAPGHERGRGKG
jgi:hypothetical protein